MAIVANGGSRRFQSVMPPKRRFETGQYGAKFKAEKKPPPRITTTLSERAKKAMSQRLSAQALGQYGKKASSIFGTDVRGYVPERGDIQALQHVSDEFLGDLTPEARTSLMNVPTRVGKPAVWYAQMPFKIAAGLLSGESLSQAAQLPPGSHDLLGNIDISPEQMEPGREKELEVLMQHELIHAWDADRMAEMRGRGETLTGLPGILDYPRQFLMHGPGGEAMAGVDMPDWLQGAMEDRYAGWLSAPEKYTMMAQTTGFDPAKIPDEYKNLYAGLFSQESFVRPPPPEPLKIEDLLEQQMQSRTTDIEHRPPMPRSVPYTQAVPYFGDALLREGLREVRDNQGVLTKELLGRVVDAGGAKGIPEDEAARLFVEAVDARIPRWWPEAQPEELTPPRPWWEVHAAR